MSYVDSSEVTQAAQPDTIPEDAIPYIATLIDRASRIFDLACGVPSGYFEEVDTEASERIAYGDGTNYLRVPAHDGDLTVTIQSNYTLPDFVERDGFLIITDSTGVLSERGWWWNTGWPRGVPVTLSARWGQEIPEDVKHAVIELTLNLYREVDPQSVKLTNIEGQPLREKLPPRVQMIANKYRMSAGVLV